jgi:hypothetical protein
LLINENEKKNIPKAQEMLITMSLGLFFSCSRPPRCALPPPCWSRCVRGLVVADSEGGGQKGRWWSEAGDGDVKPLRLAFRAREEVVMVVGGPEREKPLRLAFGAREGGPWY